MFIDQALAVVTCQVFDLLHRHAANGGCTFRAPLQGTFTQGLPAHRVLRYVIVVQPVMGNQFMHQCQRKGSIGAWQQGNVLMAFFGGFAFARVYAHQPGTAAFGLASVAPEVQVAAYRVAAPDDDEF
ncbi:hypothetical protein D9M73_43360 [compost metagenome]